MFNTQNEAVQHLENTHYAQPVQAWDIFVLTYFGGSFSFIVVLRGGSYRCKIQYQQILI